MEYARRSVVHFHVQSKLAARSGLDSLGSILPVQAFPWETRWSLAIKVSETLVSLRFRGVLEGCWSVTSVERGHLVEDEEASRSSRLVAKTLAIDDRRELIPEADNDFSLQSPACPAQRFAS